MKVKDFFQIVRTHNDNDNELRPLDWTDCDCRRKDGTMIWYSEEAMEKEIEHIDIEGMATFDGESLTPAITIYVK